MLIAGLNYEMDHQPQNTLVTTVTLLQHLQPTYQQLDSFWSWAQAKEMTKEKKENKTLNVKFDKKPIKKLNKKFDRKPIISKTRIEKPSQKFPEASQN